MSAIKIYRALRGTGQDNVWSPAGQWFVTTQHYRSNWPVEKWRHPIAWRRVIRSVLWSWVNPFIPPMHVSAYVHEYEPPFRSGRGFSFWLWGRTHLVVGRWKPSGYDPEAELEKLHNHQRDPADDLGLGSVNGHSLLRDVRTDKL